jgi:gliding motility-associated-like protein
MPVFPIVSTNLPHHIRKYWLAVFVALSWKNYAVAQSNCTAPASLFTSIRDDSTITLNWTFVLTGTGEKIYDSEYREYASSTWRKASFPYGNDTEHSLIEDAEPGSCYELRVRAICLSASAPPDTSDWSLITVNHGAASCSSPRITPCQAPFNLITSMTNDTTAEFSWSEIVGIGNYYDAEIRETNATTWEKAHFPYGNDFEFSTYNKASRGKCYEWRVRAICIYSPSSRDTSAWAVIILNSGAPTCPNAPPNPPAPSPVVSPNFSYTTEVCSPGQVSFANNTTVSGTSLRSFEWDLGDNHKSTANNPLHSYQKPGIYTVTLTVTDTVGNVYSKTHSIAIKELRLDFANAGDDLVVCGKDPLKLQATGGETYSWNPCTGLSNCNISNPTVDVGTNETYIVTMINKDGCVDSDTVSVKLIDPAFKLNVPNAFTPNNDGVNDLFRPLVSLRGNVNAEWKLFNRFGNMVFSADNTTTGWNGNYKGQPQPSGNYTYVITLKAENTCPAKLHKGTVLLIR